MTRRRLFGLLVVAPLAKFFPKKDILLKAGDRIAVTFTGNTSSAGLANLANVYYKRSVLDNLRKKFVFHDFIREGTGQTILFDRTPAPTQATFDFYDDYVEDSSDDDWGEYD